MRGYTDSTYAHSLATWGRPAFLPRSEGWVLIRSIPGEDDLDALSLYPFFVCRNWNGLSEDIAELGRAIVSLTLVTDPFGHFDENVIRQTFPHRFIPYKNHNVVDLSVPRELAVSIHHRRNVRHALQRMEVIISDNPSALLDVWCELYEVLVRRHSIKGLKRFSRSIFEKQLATPGVQVILAQRDGVPIGMTVWYVHEDVAYYHLGAYSLLGYELKASFAIFSAALEFFQSRVRWLALGASAGLGIQDDGLARFKRGWATGARQTYLCGVILDPERYRHLAKGRPNSDYFPTYRTGEFA